MYLSPFTFTATGRLIGTFGKRDFVDSRGSFSPDTPLETDPIASRGLFRDEESDESGNVIIRPMGLSGHGSKNVSMVVISRKRRGKRDVQAADQPLVTANVTLNFLDRTRN